MKKIVNEKMEWLNSNEGVMTVEIETPVTNNGNVTGKNVSVSTVQTNYDEIVNGLKVVAERIRKNKTKILEKENALYGLGPRNELTEELIKLKEDIGTINNYLTGNKITSEIQILKEDLESDEEWFNRRNEVLKTRPTDKEDTTSSEVEEIPIEEQTNLPKREPNFEETAQETQEWVHRNNEQ